jgi:energy-converting hydrogenase Eha subunit C
VSPVCPVGVVGVVCVLLQSKPVEKIVQRLIGPESGGVVVVAGVVDDLHVGSAGDSHR